MPTRGSSAAPVGHTTLSPSLAAALDGIIADVDTDLARRIACAALPDNLRDAVKYAVLGPGKRLRPALTILCCEALGGSRQAALPSASAMELIHCFSLVHDDLPAMDDDDVRRGRATLHIHAGEAMAILAGDACVSLAFEWLTEDPATNSPSALVRELARATTAMIAGQVYDTLGGFDPQLDERQRLNLTHESKTAALMITACRMGAMCANAADRQLDAITAYGHAVGLMFQVVDDILDVTQSAEHVGKAVGKDDAAGKLTFPGLLGIEASNREVQRLCSEARAAVTSLGPIDENTSLLLDLADALAVRTK